MECNVILFWVENNVLIYKVSFWIFKTMKINNLKTVQVVL